MAPGSVINTPPWSAAGRMARPAPDQAIHIARFSFDFVNADTNERQCPPPSPPPHVFLLLLLLLLLTLSTFLFDHFVWDELAGISGIQ